MDALKTFRTSGSYTLKLDEHVVGALVVMVVIPLVESFASQLMERQCAAFLANSDRTNSTNITTVDGGIRFGQMEWPPPCLRPLSIAFS
ncbi:hypothetical protein ACLOJK_027178 [Asimina triloba]